MLQDNLVQRIDLISSNTKQATASAELARLAERASFVDSRWLRAGLDIARGSSAACWLKSGGACYASRLAQDFRRQLRTPQAQASSGEYQFHTHNT